MKLKIALKIACILVFFANFLPAADSLKVTELELTAGSGAKIYFSDAGTGATGYTIESSADLASWSPQAATITSEGNDDFLATVASTADGVRFFRVLAVGGNGETAVAGFSMSDITVEEGSGSAQVTVTFSQPFVGTLRYRWNGNIIPGEDGFGTLSGTVGVSGTSAVISLTIPENSTLDEVRQLSVNIEVAETDGYETGEGTASASITVVDNDALWAGAFQHKSESIPLLFELVKNGATWSGKLLSDGTGLFPESVTGFPLSSIVFTDTVFSANANSIAIPASVENSLCSDAVLSLSMSASGADVSDTRVVGTATLNISKPGNAHLDVVLGGGEFVLVRQVVTQPSGEVTLEN